MAVVLVAAGGTIASRPRPDGAVAVALTGADLVARAGLDAGAVEVVDMARGPSWSLAPDDMAAIARTAVDRSGGAPVVVTHGTDTLEETAFLTWLLGGTTPVVFTGAMRHDAHAEADGPANLRAAVALAAAGVDGPVVHLAGESHHARWATKTDTTVPTSFRSVGGRGTPAPPPPAGAALVTDVAEVRSHVGVDGDVLGWHLDRGARGVVVQGSGAGNVHRSLLPGIERALAAGVPVVVTSRCATGPVAPVYGGPGGGHELAALGCILAGDLPTHKARLALWVALGTDDRPEAVRAWFAALLA
ncbi:MAG TPA: asparaginase domain-containing protein [Solirubrobacterales bacterium]|nr:asparaginase domain-containing protein [Solirubrobacterales bacterium]